MGSTLTHLPWDTEFFGVSVARTESREGHIEPAVRQALTQNVSCLYVHVEGARPSVVAHVVRRGGTLVDLRLELDLSTRPPLPSGIRLADRSDIPRLLPLARELSAESRYTADARFEREAIEAMYGVWLERCFENGFVLIPDRGLGGFVAGRVVDDMTWLELVYVENKSRGHGLAARLVRGAVATAGLGRARVATQAWNIAAQRLYQGAGFRTASLQAILHLWLDDLI